MKRPIVVIDTQIFLRAVGKRSSLPYRIVIELGDRYTLVTTTETESELVDVLARPKVRAKFPEITDERIEAMLAVLRTGQVVAAVEIPPTSRDPKDDKFLAAAQASDADYLVSEDNDLLTLKSFGRTRIVNALDFLQILSAMPPDES